MMSDDNGVQKIDLDKVDWRGSREFFESLGEALDKLDDKDESYDFTWVGKRKSIIEAGAPINKTLRPDVEASKNWDTTENLFIEGDNLDALKLLQESYLGKVKMIYIDPPYNTGKDFVYHDNFKATTEQYDEDTEYKDEEGNIQFKKNEKSNGRYHSDWLSMMYPRLKLARNLLSEDGVIFISIDDNEQANLKKLCDEVFGEDNYLGDFIWQKQGNDNRSIFSGVKTFRNDHDFVIAYSRNYDVIEFDRPEEEAVFQNDYGNADDDPRGNWMSAEFGKSENRSNPRGKNYYTLTTPNGAEYTRQWHYSESELKELVADNKVYFGKDGRSVPRLKKFLSEKTKKVPSSLLLKYGSTKVGQDTVDKLFSDNRYFDYPKPVELLSFLSKLAASPSSLVLDFFSGSGSTAHAVMQLNAEDGGNRKWIMVQLPEETDEKSEAFKAGYKTIPEISRERIRRAGDKIADEHPDARVDYGFRALRIDDTNHKDVYRPAADYQQNMLDELVDNVKEDRSDLDLLYGVLTATAWELNKPLETVELDGATVYKYDYFAEVSGLVACFAPEISEEAIKQIAQLKPLTAVFRESSFPNSQAKVNLAEHFRIISPETKVKVI
jgi:adenine-specific DNA-methyltransferase